ncbi:MAG: response regulator transcription factor [Acidobacteria bacterium]|nr:response regulator transcription factor [Acidobacteriota bacterium]
MNAISVVLVDDHKVVTRSLKSYLESFPDLRVVGIAASGEELLEHLSDWHPQVVVQDLLLPGGIDGIETTRRALAREPSIRVVALTASIDEGRMMAALRAGATGYIRKDAEPETLLAAIRAVARGRTFIDPYVACRVAEDATAHEELTAREREVLRHVALGLSNKDIAEALSVSEETIKTHVGHLLGKLGVENRAQAIVQALKRSLISLDELD